ncbi:hypothetical protein ACVBEH_20520 [Roseateles sp. GG27B]
MPIDYKKNQVVFSGIVSVDDADTLLAWLQNKPSAKVDLAACSHLHPANLQVLMAAGCRVSAWPVDTDLCAWLQSALSSASNQNKGR